MTNYQQNSMEQTDPFFDPKKENLSYTVAIIKPETSLKQVIVQEIIDIIEKQGFVIKTLIQRELVLQEIQNLYYKQIQKDYYKQMQYYMQSGPSIVMLLGHETEDPVQLWKKLIGHFNPDEAKKQNPESLRAKYGISLIKNEFHGSDNPFDANKDRDIFKFAIPQKIPEFQFDKFKITLDSVLKFIFPTNLEHSNVNDRLDVLALYGPCVDYHSVDKCFCVPCKNVCVKYLEKIKRDKVIAEMKKQGIEDDGGATSNKNNKFKSPYIRLMKEENIQNVSHELCFECRQHCSDFRHMIGGREGQIIMSDAEIKLLAQEMNHKELLELLTIEKGNAAEIMILDIPLIVPKELTYEKHHILELLKILETDYYQRYNFNELQALILEDRRIRILNWISGIIQKPVERFKNPKLVNPTVTKSERNDVKNINFTLNRTLPLSMMIQKPNILYTPLTYEKTIVDKTKLQKNEEKIKEFKLIHRNTHHLISIDDISDLEKTKSSLYILREYNDGKNGNWNNYCTLKGKNTIPNQRIQNLNKK